MRGSDWSVFLPPNDEVSSNNWSSSRGSNAKCPSLAKIDSISKTTPNSLPICNKSRHHLMRTRLTQPNILSQQEIRPLTSDAQSPCTYLSVFYPRTSTDRTVPRDIHRCQWANCNQKFLFMDQLVDHVNEKHVRVGRSEVEYQCKWEGCPRDGKGFNARYKMLIHIRTHTNEKPHKCLLCGKCFSRLENLKIHKRSHTGEKPYSCPVPGCNKAYSNSSDRFKHVRTHQEKKPYLCKMPGCSKRYTDPSSLRKHVRTHGHYFRRESHLTGYHKSLSNMKSVRLQLQDFTMLQNLARLDSSSLTVDAVAEANDGCPKTETRVIQKRSNDKCLDPPSLSSIFSKPFIYRNMAATHKYDPPKVTEQFPTTNFNTFLNSFDTNPQERPLDLSLTKIISIS